MAINPDFDHEFDAEEATCCGCGEVHGDCECEEFDPDDTSEDVCTQCGMSEESEEHQEEI